MNPIPGTEGLHPWAQVLGIVIFVATTAIIAAVTQHRARKQTEKAKDEDRRQTATAVTSVAAIATAAPVAQQLSNDALVQTLGGIREALIHNSAVLERLGDLLEEDAKREKAEAQKEEFMRIVRDELRRNAEAQGVTLTRIGDGGPR